jgi:hypothetical protein
VNELNERGFREKTVREPSEPLLPKVTMTYYSDDIVGNDFLKAGDKMSGIQSSEETPSAAIKWTFRALASLNSPWRLWER